MAGVVVTGPLSTTAPSDTYPTHDATLGLGGKSEVATLVLRNAISSFRRAFGMIVTVNADGTPANNKTYILANVALGGTNNTLTDNANWIEFGASTGIISIPVSRTVYVDYVNGNNGTGLPQRLDKPFLTKAAAITSALTLIPTATDRVLISVATGLSAEQILFPSSCLGIDFDLNGGSLAVVGGADGSIDDGNFACDSILHNVGNVSRVGGGSLSVRVRNAATKLTIYGENILARTSVENGTVNIKCNTLTGADSMAVVSAGVLNLNCSSVLASGAGSAVTVSGGIANVTANSFQGNPVGAAQGAVIFSGGILNLNGDIINPSGYGIALNNIGTFNHISGSITGVAAAIYANGTTCTFHSSPSARIVATGVSKPAIETHGTTTVIKLNSPTLIATGVNSVVSSNPINILLYGAGQQNVIEDANTTFLIGNMITDAAVI